MNLCPKESDTNSSLPICHIFLVAWAFVSNSYVRNWVGWQASWKDCLYLCSMLICQAPFFWAKLSLLMDFCGWSRLAEGEDKDQVFLISLAIGGKWFTDQSSISKKKGRPKSKIHLSISQHGVKNCFSLGSFSEKLQLLYHDPTVGSWS